ncbi:MAG: DUF1573 domain-containing protein [Planctomycetes bacterium]|nr:DUF1573 domain-containing protein [Planctomycetota bacterium]
MKHLVYAVAALLGTAASALAGPGDLFTEKVMDFGTTPRGTVLVHYFRFTNNTTQTLNLGTPRVSCGCTSASVSKAQVAPGETAAVIAYMDTRRIPTPNVTKSVLVYVPFLSPTQEEVTLRVQTVARDDLMMSPDTIAIGNVKAGAGAKMSTKVTFMSDPNWKITEAKSTGGFVQAEVKEESRSGSMVTYEVSAILDKACPAGNWVSDINLTTSNPAVGKLRVPVTVNVTVPQVAITPESATFGNLPMGVEMEKKITLKSGKPFKILEVKGADEQLKITVDKNASSDVHTIVVAANPKAVGGFTRMVEITTDDKDQPKLIIPVTAKVVEK